MRKRILPTLLALVLTLSLMPVAFAASSYKTVTLVQETIGDPNREFEYYFYKDTLRISSDSGAKIEIIKDVTFFTCSCLFNVNSAIPNYKAIWEDHRSHRCSSYSYITRDCYKVTLKSGEKVTISEKYDRMAVYTTIQDDRDQILYSNDGKNFINYVDNVSVGELDKTVATIRFTLPQNGTIAIRRSDGSAPDYTPPTDPGTSFPDVSKSADYAAAVEYVNKLGIMVGDEKGNFNPDKIVSRAEMATIVCRMLGQTANLPKANVFTDVPMAYWANEYIGKAAELGIVTGYPGGKFGPSDPVTYEQAVTMIVRAIGEEDLAISYGGYPNGHWLVAYQKNLLKEVTYLWGQGMPRSAVAVLVYNYYTAAPGVGHTHNWAIRHVDEVEHYEESSGTHKVMITKCKCGYTLSSDTPNANALWSAHNMSCKSNYIWWYEDVPNDPQYVIDTPAHDETYCTICGAVQ